MATGETTCTQGSAQKAKLSLRNTGNSLSFVDSSFVVEEEAEGRNKRNVTAEKSNRKIRIVRERAAQKETEAPQPRRTQGAGVGRQQVKGEMATGK